MKILIYADKGKLKPIGGPYGYLYNLFSGLLDIKNDEVHCLNENQNHETIQTRNRAIFMKLKKDFWLPYFILKTLLGKGAESDEDFNAYDVIHFHTTVDLYNNRKKLNDYHGQVLLTSHSPKVFFEEFYDTISAQRFPFKKAIKRAFEKVDKFAFDRADCLVFPCEEAMEPYCHTWKYFNQNYDFFIRKTRFLLTGMKRKKEISAYDFSFIPNRNNKFIVCFTGRHNEIKGYDLLLKAAKKIEDIDPSIVFVIAGKEGPLFHDETLNNWFELGWTDNPLGVIKSSDLFVLPNRETYFDLALIEALSTPNVVLLSETGGNKYYKKYDLDSIHFFEKDSIDDLVEQIINIRKHSKQSLKIQMERNEQLYLDEFLPSTFARNYLGLVANILNPSE